MTRSTPQVHSQVREWRERSGLRPAELAERVGITRQALHSIETGGYTPNTLIALQLARLFGCAVEDLFTLGEAQVQATATGQPSLQPSIGERVRLAQVGERWLAFSVTGQGGLTEQADGVVTDLNGRQVTVELFSDLTLARRTAVLAGCDPAFALLTSHVSQQPGSRILLDSVSSKAALRALSRGEAHAAGIHLFDAASGTSNLPFVQQMFRGQDIRLFTLWSWEQGLQVAPGNPRDITGVGDLLRPDIRLQNREPDAGSRGLLEAWLDSAGIGHGARTGINGYADEVTTPLEAARRVASGAADVAPGPRSAAVALGLDFVPLQVERFDLVVPAPFVGHPGVQALLNVVQQPAFRSELRTLGGYDPAHAGELWKTTA